MVSTGFLKAQYFLIRARVFVLWDVNCFSTEQINPRNSWTCSFCSLAYAITFNEFITWIRIARDNLLILTSTGWPIDSALLDMLSQAALGATRSTADTTGWPIAPFAPFAIRFILHWKKKREIWTETNGKLGNPPRKLPGVSSKVAG